MKKAPLGAYFVGGGGSGIQWVTTSALNEWYPQKL